MAVLHDIARPVPFQPEPGEVDRVAIDEEPGGHGVALSGLAPNGGDSECTAVFERGEALLQRVLGHYDIVYRTTVGGHKEEMSGQRPADRAIEVYSLTGCSSCMR